MVADKSIAGALSALEGRVREEMLRHENEAPSPQMELQHRATDYRSWQRFGLAPQQVDDLMTTVSDSFELDLGPAELRNELLAMLVRLYEELASDRPVSAPDQGNIQPK